MSTTLSFKPNFDIPLWRPQAQQLSDITLPGYGFAWDMRNDNTRISRMFFTRGVGNVLDFYDPVLDGWQQLASPGLQGGGPGQTQIFHPSQGPRGILSSGNSATTVVLSTALPAAVGINQLASSGSIPISAPAGSSLTYPVSQGYRIRIIGNSSGGSGKIEERFIVGNTSGTTPTLTLDTALSFTPQSGDAYEIISGRVFLLGPGTTAQVIWLYYDVATNSFSSTLSRTNLPTIGTDSSMVALSELHVPNTHRPGEGMLTGGSTYDTNNSNNLRAIACTAVANNTITATGIVESTLQANEYTNFQIRIVYDPTNVTAVGQRRTISSHTAGASAVFTIGSNWTVNPSTSALFVIENNDNLILLRTSAQNNLYTYSISGNAWDASSTFAAPGNAGGGGYFMEQCFGITYDTTHNRRHSHIFCWRGGATATLDMLDIANGANGTWTTGVTYGGNNPTTVNSPAFGPTGGFVGAYDPVTLGGKYIYFSGVPNSTTIQAQMWRFNVLTQNLEPFTPLRVPWISTGAYTGTRLGFNYLIDGTTKLAVLYQAMNGARPTWSDLYAVAIPF